MDLLGRGRDQWKGLAVEPIITRVGFFLSLKTNSENEEQIFLLGYFLVILHNTTFQLKSPGGVWSWWLGHAMYAVSLLKLRSTIEKHPS